MSRDFVWTVVLVGAIALGFGFWLREHDKALERRLELEDRTADVAQLTKELLAANRLLDDSARSWALQKAAHLANERRLSQAAGYQRERADSLLALVHESVPESLRPIVSELGEACGTAIDSAQAALESCAERAAIAEGEAQAEREQRERLTQQLEDSQELVERWRDEANPGFFGSLLDAGRTVERVIVFGLGVLVGKL